MSCPQSHPQQLTTEKRETIKKMILSKDYRHIPTGTLAVRAMLQRETARADPLKIPVRARYGPDTTPLERKRDTRCRSDYHDGVPCNEVPDVVTRSRALRHGPNRGDRCTCTRHRSQDRDALCATVHTGNSARLEPRSVRCSSAREKAIPHDQLRAAVCIEVRGAGRKTMRSHKPPG